jgi:hypothetical protein
MTNSTIPPAPDDLVFVCGALRSGTTLLRLMIDGHPALSNPGEMDFLFEPPPVRDGGRDMKAYASDLAFNRVFAGAKLELTEGLSYEDQVRDFIRQLRKPGKRLTINIHRHFERIPELFPSARFVHLLRDPRDAAKSAIAMGWAGNVFHGVDHWIKSERSFERLAAATFPERIFQLKNEDLIRAPRQSLIRLCAFLGEAYDNHMLDYPSRSTYGPPDIKLVEQWRGDLSLQEIALIEGKAGGMLIERGYELSGAEQLVPNALYRAALRADNSWKRWRFNTRRHGIGVAALDLAARGLRIRALEDFIRTRKAANELRHLK